MNTARTVFCLASHFSLLAALLTTGLPASAQENNPPRAQSRHVTPVTATSPKTGASKVGEQKDRQGTTTMATDKEQQNEPGRPPYLTYDGAENAPR